MFKPIEEIFVNIIRDFMALPQENVWIRDQNRKIPTNNDLHVIVGIVDSKPYSAQSFIETRYTEGSDPVPYEVQITRAQVRENVQIDVLSRSVQALLKRNDIYLALNSFSCKQAQENYNFKIARIPTNFVNTSGAEGGSSLNRFTIIVPCLTWYSQEGDMPTYDYYDKFKTRVDDEETIGTEEGIFEFEITPDTPDPAQLA